MPSSAVLQLKMLTLVVLCRYMYTVDRPPLCDRTTRPYSLSLSMKDATFLDHVPHLIYAWILSLANKSMLSA